MPLSSYLIVTLVSLSFVSQLTCRFIHIMDRLTFFFFFITLGTSECKSGFLLLSILWVSAWFLILGLYEGGYFFWAVEQGNKYTFPYLQFSV